MEWGNASEKYKTFFIIVLVFFCLVLTYYFHFVLQTGIIFTHFFYIPIVLSAIWWRRKGLFVALFLALVLIFSDFIYSPKSDPFIEDIIRMVIFVSVSVIVVVVSERIEKSRQELHDSEEKYRSVVQSAAEAIITVDGNGKVVSWNNEAKKMFCYHEDEIMGKSVTTLMPARYIEKFNKIRVEFRESKNETYSIDDEFKGMRKDGSEFPFHASGSIWYSKGHKFFTTVIKDLSKEKEAEKISATLAAIVENTSDAIVGQTLEGIILSWNQGAEKVYGYKREEMIGNSISKLFPKGSNELEQILSTISSGKYIRNYITKRITKEGKEIDISLTSSPIKDVQGKIIGASSISRDITDQKKAEDALKENEAQLSLLTNNMADVICRADKEAVYIYVSPSVKQVYGFKPSDMMGKTMFDFIHPDDVKNVNTCMGSAMEKCESQSVEYRFRTLSGKYKWVETSGTPLYDENNKLDGFVCTSREIDARKKAEEALIESEEKYRSLIEGAKDPISLIGPNGIILMCNSAGAINLGVTPKEMKGKNLRDYFPQSAGKQLEYITKVLNSGKGLDTEMPISDSGTTIWYSTSIQPLKKADGSIMGVQVISRDITSIKETEWKLKKTLEEKEMLMKEIYHRVKNNLMVISSLLNLQSRYIKDQEAKGMFKESQDRARSMALIHERLYQSMDLKHIDFGDYLRTITKDLFDTYAGETSKINLRMDIGEVMLDINTSIPLGLIVNEIISNSLKHAFPDEREGQITIKLYEKDNKYFLEIMDDGVGIPSEIDLEKTESLGMQLIHNLTSQIDGKLDIKTDHGTCIKIQFIEKKY